LALADATPPVSAAFRSAATSLDSLVVSVSMRSTPTKSPPLRIPRTNEFPNCSPNASGCVAAVRAASLEIVARLIERTAWRTSKRMTTNSESASTDTSSTSFGAL
jgi:hypothetical protein